MEKQAGFDLLGALVAFESGELDDDSTVDLFQRLVDSGMAWTLQGAYGRTAMALLAAGVIIPRTQGPIC